MAEQQEQLNLEIAPAAVDKAADEPQEAPAKPRRRTKAAPKKAAPVSDEVAQARALAQISQASVARAQRRAVERAAEVIAEGGEEPEAPKRRATRKRAVKAEVPAVEGVVADIPAAAPAEAPAPKRRTRRKVAEAEQVEVTPAEAPAEEAPKPKRGRKPKAAKAEEAASGATAENASAAESPAPEAAPAEAEQPEKRPRRRTRKAKTEDAAETPEASSDDAPQEPASEDVRPGRSRRAAKDKDKDKGKVGDEAAKDGEAPSESEGHHRQHQNRRDRNNDRSERNDRRSNRRDRNDRKSRNNRFNVPTEPSLSREDLSAMKVAELREKGKELDLDVTGKKKAELVEEIYIANAHAEGFREITGILDIANEGFGYIRAHGYMPSRDDAFVPANLIRGARLRPGDIIEGTLRPSRANDKFPGLAKIKSINGHDPEEMRHRPKFSELTPIYPNEPLKMEHGRDSITGRAIDIVSPIGKGQRGLIVSPPKAGKTTILKKICQSIAANNPEVHLICLLVDERPEEVTDMQRSIKGDVVASTFDMPADNHTRVSELVIERAKRIVEMGGDVVVVLDSITRLARAYNLAAPASGRILSGGVDSAALYPPKRFLGAARNIENGGSLTILASALVDTGSKMDEVIFEEFKGTGNMELKLDRDLADRRIFPAIDPVASGTRNEDLLVDENLRPFVWGIRRVLANMNNTERAAASFIKGLKNTETNQEFLIRTAKKAADHEAQY